MAENYLMLNGKRVDLTDEQIAKLGLKKESPFCIEGGSYYYYTTNRGTVCEDYNHNDTYDKALFAVANACKDRKLMEQRAMHETLDRLLWRFACENGELENPWDYKSQHWYFYRQKTADGEEFKFCYKTSTKEQVAYFPTEELAHRAVDEIIVPFMQKHPDFVW